MEQPSEKPLFRLPRDSQTMLNWMPVVDELRKTFPANGFVFNISFERLEQNMAATATELFDMILVLQHYPDILDQMLCNIDLQFIGKDGNVDSIKEKSLPRYQLEFLCLLGAPIVFPVCTFFLKNPLLRRMAIKGDLILKHRNFGIRAQRTITDRVYNSSRHLLYLCYGTGVNPRPHIEALMQMMEIEFSYNALLTDHASDINEPHFPMFKSLFNNEAGPPVEITFGQN